jgi:hypothetical protein
VASIKWVKVVVPVIGRGFSADSTLLLMLEEFEVGEAGGERGEGGGEWVQEAEIGLVGSEGEKERDVTFVSS